MRLRFRCGCPALEANVDKLSPKCPRCGERKVARVLGETRPRIVGHGRGPLMESKALDAIEVTLAPKGALKVKPRKDIDHGRALRQPLRAH